MRRTSADVDETLNPGTNAPRRRRRGRRGGGGAGSPPAPAPARDTPKKPILTPAKPAAGQAAALAAEEQAWERTHLEQVMFRLAREHAEAAARSAAALPPEREGERTHSLLAVLMAYFAVEAFINMVGQDRLGARFRHYDRMSPEGKWLEVTRLVSKSGRTFDEDGKELSALSTLRSWRNTLTHYKGRYEDTQAGGETQVDALLSAENAKQAVETATILYRAFYELDRRSAPRQFVWLDDRTPARP
ncbi:MAG TPA: hypothetical protein VJT33_02185, partial [bacterium]|nr:hypothetical protein [bacterium]